MTVTVHPLAPVEVYVVQPERRPSQRGAPQPRSAPEPPPVLAAPGPPPRPRTPEQPAQPARQSSGRPSYFPSGFAWLLVGIGRSSWGAVGALIGTWFLLPVAIFMAVVTAILLGFIGLVGGTLAGVGWAPSALGGVPVLSDAVDTVLPALGGALGAVVGVLLGLVLGFVGTLQLLWGGGFSDDPLAGTAMVLVAAVAGLLVGLLYTGYRIVFESALLRAAGVRRMSRRESALLLPVIQSCAARLGLPDYPPILVDDHPEPTATAYTRHIVISRGLLDEFDRDPEVLAGALCHEIVHWRNGDPVGAAFVRGVALPLYLIYRGLRWLTLRAERDVGLAFAIAMSPLMLLGWLVFWPVAITIRWFVLPLHARAVRKAEFRADQGAVRAGHSDGLRQVLERLPTTFEAGRNGWEEMVARTHPPNELRLERLEDG